MQERQQEQEESLVQKSNQTSQYYNIINPKTDFYCQQNNKARLFCCSPNCNQKIIICFEQQCQYCQEKHQKCKSYKINTLIRQILSKRQLCNQQIEKSVKLLEKIFDQAIQKISDDKVYFIDQMQLIGFNQNQLKFLESLENGNLNKMTGKNIKDLIDGLNWYQKWKLTQEKIHKYWNAKKDGFYKIFNSLRNLWTLNKKKIDSLVCKEHSQFKFIENLWVKRQIQEYKLIYRASDNKFSTQIFHKLCDKKKGLLILARTQFGKNIGAYSSLDWDVQRQNRKPEPIKGQGLFTWLFSLSNKQKFFLGKNKETALINKGLHYGPTFGNKDFWISDKANNTKQNKSYFDLGNTYVFSHFYEKKQDAIKAFKGKTNGKNVRLVQWQVFELIDPPKNQ